MAAIMPRTPSRSPNAARPAIQQRRRRLLQTGDQSSRIRADHGDMSEDGRQQMTGRDVLPSDRRGRRMLPPEQPPLPTVVLMPGTDHRARTWVDLALASANELEETLTEERAAHTSTEEQLARQRASTAAALARAEAAEATVRELTVKAAEAAQARDRALSERQHLEAELAFVTELAAAADAQGQLAQQGLQALETEHRALRGALADRTAELTDLQARLETTTSSFHRLADERNKAVLDSILLAQRVDLLTAQLERIREAVR
jgi:hypothetical protein